MPFRKLPESFALTLGLSVLFACSGSTNKDSNRSGIEVGNPNITVSAEFQLVEGVPSYQPKNSLNKLALSSDEVNWVELNLPLQEVRYYASYYYYMPTDPKEGARLWPPLGTDTLLQLDLLRGDTLVADFQNMDIPSRSYLKEVGILFNLSKWVFQSKWCPDAGKCKTVFIRFPDSLNVDIRFHHTQMERNADSLLARLPVHFHPQVMVSPIDLSQATGDTLEVDADSTIIENFCQSFNGLRYFYHRGSYQSPGNLLIAAAAQFDSVGKETLLNGDFSSRGAHWIFLTQEGGRADTSYEDNAVKISSTKAGNKDFAIQWMQEDVELIQGRWYRIRFTAWANKPSTVLMARIGRFHAPYDNLDRDNEDYLAALSTEPKTFEWEFMAKETNLFGRLEFNAGLFERDLWIQNVSLMQVEE